MQTVINDFHNGGRSAKPGDSSNETRSQRPQRVAFVYYRIAASSGDLHNNSSNAILLTAISMTFQMSSTSGIWNLESGRWHSRCFFPRSKARRAKTVGGDSWNGLKTKAERERVKTKMLLTWIRTRFTVAEKNDRVPPIILRARIVFQCNFPSTVGVLRWKRCPCLKDSKWTATFWRNLKQKLLSYFFTHFIKFAPTKMHDGNCQVVSTDIMVLQYVTTSATWCQILSGCI